MSAIGFDFGTTNSAFAVVDGAGAARVSKTYRSVLHFDGDERERGKPRATVGPGAIERHVEEPGGRLIQSMKSYLGSRQFRATNVFGTNYTLEELIAIVVRGVRKLAAAELGELDGKVVVGRPVRFAGEDEDQGYALERLEKALALGGVTDVVFELEPIAAAYHYEQALDHDELVLIADFGGGTSDFCLVRVGPRARGAKDRVLGTEGVALAGDAFDARIVRHLVAPVLGKGTEYVIQGKELPVPPWLFGHLERWHHLSFLKSRETLALFDRISEGARAPEKIAMFRHLVDEDLGYALSLAVQRTKIALSGAPKARFTFEDDPIAIAEDVARTSFDQWISDERAAIDACLDRLFGKAGVAPRDVDRVFMTGGSSLVPVVRKTFATRFGEERLAGGDELTSVASGLALRARDL